MTNKEIRKIEQELYEIQTTPPSGEQLERIEVIAKKIGASTLEGHYSNCKKNINIIAANIHTVLQTEMMLNACVFAKRSCFWAAVAAVVALISVVLVLFHS